MHCHRALICVQVIQASCCTQVPVSPEQAVEPHYGTDAALKAADGASRLAKGLAAQLQGSSSGSSGDLQSAINLLNQSVQVSMHECFVCYVAVSQSLCCRQNIVGRMLHNAWRSLSSCDRLRLLAAIPEHEVQYVAIQPFGVVGHHNTLVLMCR